MLIHCVNAGFKDAVTPAQVVALDSANAALRGQIELIPQARHGLDVGERPTNADYAMVLELDDAEAFFAYWSAAPTSKCQSSNEPVGLAQVSAFHCQ